MKKLQEDMEQIVPVEGEVENIEDFESINSKCNSCSDDGKMDLLMKQINNHEMDTNTCKKIKDSKNQGSQCTILDNDQLQLLVFDSICYNSKIKKMIESKRKYIYVPSEIDESGEVINEK